MKSPANRKAILANALASSASPTVRILVVDDNRDVLNFLSAILNRQGLEVLTARDLSSALRMVSEADLDLIISDIELPDGSGHELMRVVRSRRPIPGIALSGFAGPEDVAQSRAAGFAFHLTKPVDIRRLQQVIEELTTPAQAAAMTNP
jgi:CheY-like chemotaxis protein